ncbi:PBPe domain-containing protein [Caenorhabditis elegans]|uniref:PBPe domain-containing protein n=1 Tax=Caenorhabditis elegans TaxID=6239 RepID=Q19450_CAEEL|nr:PBPe domain-containing protein [Caenorhabditis elegans]CAB01154.1 PBPe domain-containing protein [Caenorhabditis elegans]|eukprot:NP_506546.1 Uncharacterized protein CELE_F14D7.8 [Caenorhabditis elegans]
MGIEKHACKVAGTRKIILIYSLVGLLTFSYFVCAEPRILIRANNFVHLALHAIVLFGVYNNTERSLRWSANIVYFYVLLYFAIFLVFPVMLASCKASGILPGITEGKVLKMIDKVLGRNNEPFGNETAAQIDVHIKHQLFKVFGDDFTKNKVNSMILCDISRKQLLKMPQHSDFKLMEQSRIYLDNYASKVVFEKILQDVRRDDECMYGLIAGLGMGLFCYMLYGLIYLEHAMLKQLWSIAVIVKPTEENYSNF